MLDDFSINIDPGEAEWERAIARDWESDWNDPREDIYSLADGVSVIEPVEIDRAEFPSGGLDGP